jgi:hypothetical protein
MLLLANGDLLFSLCIYLLEFFYELSLLYSAVTVWIHEYLFYVLKLNFLITHFVAHSALSWPLGVSSSWFLSLQVPKVF